MTKDERRHSEKWLKITRLIPPLPQLIQAEKDIRTLMKQCGDLTKELENRKLAEEEQRRRLLLEFIPVADALEAFARYTRHQNPLSDRDINELDMLRRRLARAFERSGLTRLPIQTGQTPLDATCHEVLRAEARDGVVEGTILEVVKPGYLLGGRVLRPAKVVVATCEE